MSALGDLRKTNQKLDEFRGDNIRDFLEWQSSALTARGYEADEHIETPVEELELDPEKYARWLLGQLLAVHRDSPDPQILISSLVTWRIYTIKVLNPKTEETTGDTE